MRQDGVFEFSLVPPRPVAPPVSEGDRLARLTPQERKVVETVAQGFTNKEAAREMGGMSPHTVATHLRRAYVKLRVNNRAQLVRLLSLAERAC